MKSEPKKHLLEDTSWHETSDIFRGDPNNPGHNYFAYQLIQPTRNERNMLYDVEWYSDAIRCHIIWCCMLSPCWLVTSPLWPHRFQFLRVHQAAVATPARVRRVDRSGWRMRRAMRSCQWPPTCSQLRNSMHHFCNTAWPVSTLKTCQYPESIKTSSTLRATHFNCNTMVNW